MTVGQMILDSSAVLLDFDGIIVDSEQRQSVAWNATLRKHGVYPSVPLVVTGRMDEEIALSLGASEEEAVRLLSSKRVEFNSLYGDSQPPLLEGVKEFVLEYQTIGVLGITSNSSRERVIAICDHYGLTSAFSVIVAARGNCKPKPSPEVYIIALKSINISPEQVIAIEDSPSGLLAAKSAGIRTIGIPTSLPKSDLAKIADATVDSFRQIMDEWKFLLKDHSK